MLNELLKKIKDRNIIRSGEKIVVGFSSGPDSVFLLELLKKMDIDIILVHINHMLREEESEKDEEFAKNIAKELNLPIFVKRVDLVNYSKNRGLGLEEAGREVRYSYFDEVLKEKKADRIAIAHNLDDQIENFLFRMIRGCSLQGLEGIPSRENIVRPINELYKSEIVNYLDSNKIRYRVDKTNFESEFTRNSIRLELIPFIEKRYNISFKDKIHNLIDEIREVNIILKVDLTRYKKEIENRVVLDIGMILKESDYLKRKIINEYLKEFKIESTREKIINIQNILNTGGSKTLNLNKRHTLKKEYNYLWIEEKQTETKDKEEKKEIKKEKEQTKNKRVEVKIPFKIKFGDFILEAIEYDKNKENEENNKNEFLTNLKAGDRLKIGYKRDGDKIQPLGMNSYKKVKDIFINEKIPKDRRESIPVISKDDEIVWLAGVKKSEKFKSKEIGKGIKLIVRRENAKR